MRPENPNWILVEGSTPDAIRAAVVEHSAIATPVLPIRHRITVLPLDADRCGVTFDPPAPPYAFANLIGWLDDPRMTNGAYRAVGWLVAPSSGVRYFLAPWRANAGGDTLVGVGSDGGRVSVFLPDCTVRPCGDRVEAIPEPELPTVGVEAAVEFDVTLDGDASFGNPRFVVG